jgi:hypothetical protein
VKFSANQKSGNHGLAMCIYNGSITVRMLVSKEGIVTLRKVQAIDELGYNTLLREVALVTVSVIHAFRS